MTSIKSLQILLYQIKTECNIEIEKIDDVLAFAKMSVYKSVYMYVILTSDMCTFYILCVHTKIVL